MSFVQTVSFSCWILTSLYILIIRSQDRNSVRLTPLDKNSLTNSTLSWTMAEYISWHKSLGLIDKNTKTNLNSKRLYDPLTVFPDFDSCYSHFMPYRMTPSVRHRAIKIHYYYYLLKIYVLFVFACYVILFWSFSSSRCSLSVQSFVVIYSFMWSVCSLVPLSIFCFWLKHFSAPNKN